MEDKVGTTSSEVWDENILVVVVAVVEAAGVSAAVVAAALQFIQASEGQLKRSPWTDGSKRTRHRFPRQQSRFF